MRYKYWYPNNDITASFKYTKRDNILFKQLTHLHHIIPWKFNLKLARHFFPFHPFNTKPTKWQKTFVS